MGNACKYIAQQIQFLFNNESREPLANVDAREVEEEEHSSEVKTSYQSP